MPRPGQFLTAMVHEAMASPSDNIYMASLVATIYWFHVCTRLGLGLGIRLELSVSVRVSLSVTG